MEITLNGERRKANEGESLLDLIDSLGLPRDAVVAERNGTIVDRAAFGSTVLEPADVIEFVRFVGGG